MPRLIVNNRPVEFKLDSQTPLLWALRDAANLCRAVGADGLRGELTLLRAARAQAAYEGAATVSRSHLKTVATSTLSHRLRRDPLDEAGSGARVARILAETLP